MTFKEDQKQNEPFIVPIAAASNSINSSDNASDKHKKSLSFRASALIGIYSLVSMSILYGFINYSLLAMRDENDNPKIKPGLIYAFLTTGVLANAFFADSSYKQALIESKEKMPWWKKLGYALAFIFSLLSCICLYWAGLFGLKFATQQITDHYRQAPLSSTQLLWLSLILVPGIINESFFTARSAGLLLAASKIYWNTLRSGYQKNIEGDTILTYDAARIIKITENKSETSNISAYESISYKSWYIALRYISEVVAWSTAIAYCLNGLALIEQAIQLIYNFASNSNCDPLVETDCGPDLSNIGYQMAFFMATSMAGAFGVIYGREGTFELFYTLPARAIKNPSLKNFLSIGLVYSLLGLCCGNALAQGLIAESALILVILGAISPMITNMSETTRNVSDSISGAINKAGTTVGQGISTAATTIYKELSCKRDAATNYTILDAYVQSPLREPLMYR